jgi:hypothetical protein
MRKLVFILAFLLTSCYSSTIYKPELRYTEAEVSIVFDRKGFRGIRSWGWQVGTLCIDYDRYKKWSIYGWPEEVDMLEEWIYILGETDFPPPKNPYHSK